MEGDEASFGRIDKFQEQRKDKRNEKQDCELEQQTDPSTARLMDLPTLDRITSQKVIQTSWTMRIMRRNFRSGNTVARTWELMEAAIATRTHFNGYDDASSGQAETGSRSRSSREVNA